MMSERDRGTLLYGDGTGRGHHFKKNILKKKESFPIKEVISIAIQMCNGIGAAHAAGIVHRDINLRML